jgi:hypothetical protein
MAGFRTTVFRDRIAQEIVDTARFAVPDIALFVSYATLNVRGHSPRRSAK